MKNHQNGTIENINFPTTTCVYESPKEIDLFLRYIQVPTKKNAPIKEELQEKFLIFLEENFKDFIGCEIEFFIPKNKYFSHFQGILTGIGLSGNWTGTSLFLKVETDFGERKEIFPIELFRHPVTYRVVYTPEELSSLQKPIKKVKNKVEQVFTGEVEEYQE